MIDVYESKLCKRVKNVLRKSKVEVVTRYLVNDREKHYLSIKDSDMKILYDLTGVHIGGQANKILGEVLRMHASTEKKNERDDQLVKEKTMIWDRYRDKIYFHVVKKSRNQKFLEKLVHIDILDLVMVFYYFCDVPGEDDRRYIHKSMFKQWGITEDDLSKNAYKNTVRDYPAYISFNSDQGIRRQWASGCLKNIETQYKNGKLQSLVLSNKDFYYGAAVIFYADILHKISRIYGTDLYILPISVHQVSIVPCETHRSHENMNEQLQLINCHIFQLTDVLSDHIYRYDRDARNVVIDNQKFMVIQKKQAEGV